MYAKRIQQRFWHCHENGLDLFLQFVWLGTAEGKEKSHPKAITFNLFPFYYSPQKLTYTNSFREGQCNLFDYLFGCDFSKTEKWMPLKGNKVRAKLFAKLIVCRDKTLNLFKVFHYPILLLESPAPLVFIIIFAIRMSQKYNNRTFKRYQGLFEKLQFMA